MTATQRQRGFPWHATAVAVVVFLLAAWLTVPAAPPAFDWDDAYYAWMTEWFSGRQAHREVAWAMMQARQYPPLLPVVMSLTGSFLEAQSPALLLNAAFLALAACALAFWLARLGLSPLSCIAGGLLLAFNPVMLSYGPALISEPLFLLLTVAALLCWNQGRDDGRWVFAAGLLAGLAVATRSAGWALVVALVLGPLLQRRWGAFRALLPGLALGLAVHFLLKSRLPPAHSYVEGYLDNLSQMGFSFLVGQLQALWQGLVSLCGSVVGAAVLTVLVLPGLAGGIRKGSVHAWYVLVSLGMIIAWPFPGQMDRFLWVLVPPLLASAAETLKFAAHGRTAAVAAPAALMLVLLLSLPGGLYRSAERILNGPGGELASFTRSADWTRPEDRATALVNAQVRQRLIEDAREIGELTQSRDCIYSELPAVVSFHGRRVAFGSPWPELDVDQAASGHCRYYYLVPGAMRGAEEAGLQSFGEVHAELFRSTAPWDPSASLGVFYRLELGSE